MPYGLSGQKKLDILYTGYLSYCFWLIVLAISQLYIR